MYQLANLESRFQAPPAGPAATAAVTHCAIGSMQRLYNIYTYAKYYK